MGNFELTRLTTAQIRGKAPPSPIYYTLHLSTEATSKWFFVPRLSKGSLKIARVKTLAILWGYNFSLKPPIGTRSKANL
jgi:hypothetical protein